VEIVAPPPLLPTVKLSRSKPEDWTGSSLTTVACSIDKSGQCLAESTKSSVSRSSTFFISPLANCIRLPFLKYGGVTVDNDEGREVVEELVEVEMSEAVFAAIGLVCAGFG